MSRKLSHLGVHDHQGPIEKCLRHVDWWRHRWRYVTLWRETRDVTIVKVVAFGNYRIQINYPCRFFKHIRYRRTVC